jgi:WD40 repeat protein
LYRKLDRLFAQLVTTDFGKDLLDCTKRPIQMARIFISHSSRDPELASQMKEWLHGHGFDQTFLDFDKHAGIAPGADWEKTLYREIERCEAIIIILTTNWLDSKWCFVEFAQARALGKSIVPVIEASIGDRLISPDIQHLDLTCSRDAGLQQLLDRLRQVSLDAQGGFHLEQGRPPYPGLLSFQEKDAAVYFGRDDGIRRLIERLNARRVNGGAKVVAVLGASGSGKSSLIRAGVIPRLKRDSQHWIVLPILRPQRRPLSELSISIAIAVGDTNSWQSWRDRLTGSYIGTIMEDLGRELRFRAQANEAQILVPIDQGEELFGIAEAEEADHFFRVLNTIASDQLPFLFVLAMRSDYLGLLQAEDLKTRFEEFSLEPLQLSRIPQIIKGPATVVGLGIEEELVQQATRDAETEDALPLLAFALRELYDRHTDDGPLTLNEYHALGDQQQGLTPLENAVRLAADEVLAELSPNSAQLQALRETFVPEMVRVNDVGEYVRREADWADLPEAAHPILEALVKARLLTSRQEGNQRLVEVSHEALLRKWPRLRGWLDEEREFLIGRQQLERDSTEWNITPESQKTRVLLDGLKLDRAASWLSDRPSQLKDGELEFIRASIKYRNRVKQVRKAAVFVAFIFISAFAAIASWQWWEASAARSLAEQRGVEARASEYLAEVQAQQARTAQEVAEARTQEAIKEREAADQARGRAERQARIALSHQLTALARSVAERYPERALLLAVEAMRGPLEAVGLRAGWAESLIRERLSAQGAMPVRTWHDDIPQDLDPQGRWLVSELDHGNATVGVWDLADSYAEPVVMHGVFLYMGYALDPNGRWMAATGASDTALWDLANPSTEKIVLGNHEGGVLNPVFDPQARWLAASDNYGNVVLWSLATPAANPVVLRGDGYYVEEKVFDPQGRWFATGGKADGTTRLWDLHDLGAESVVLRGHDKTIVPVAFDYQGRWLFTASSDDTAQLWDIAQPVPVRVSLRGHEVESSAVMALDPQGRWLATANRDHALQLWDLANPETEPVIMHGHENTVTTLAFDPKGRWLATASLDGTARLWDLANLATEALVLGGHERGIWTLAFDPKGRWLAIWSMDGTVRLWDLDQQGAAPVVLRVDEGSASTTGRFPQLVFHPQGRWLTTGGSDGRTKLWDLANKKDEPMVLRGHEGGVHTLVFYDQGRGLATGGWDGTARLWDLAQPNAEPVVLRETDGNIYTLAIDPHGRWLAAGGEDDMARLWDLTAPETEPVVLGGHEERMHTLAIDPQGRWLAMEGWDAARQESKVRLWDLAKPKSEPIVLRGHAASSKILATDPLLTLFPSKVSEDDQARTLPILLYKRKLKRRVFRTLAFDQKGRWLATGGLDGWARLWDLTKLEAESVVLPRGDVVAHILAFDQKGRWLATGGMGVGPRLDGVQTVVFPNKGRLPATEGMGLLGGTVRLWDLTQPKVKPVTLQPHWKLVSALSFDPLGRWLATGSEDGTVQLWDLDQPNAKPVVLHGHEGNIHALAIAPKGYWLAEGGEDDAVRLWDLNMPEMEPVVLRGHMGDVSTLAFDPRERYLATGSMDGTVLLWDLSIDNLVRSACRGAGRNLTREEWNLYLSTLKYRATCPEYPLQSPLFSD